MKAESYFLSEKGNLLADLGNGLFVGKANEMELAICRKGPTGYEITKTVIPGFMMKTNKDFHQAVKNLMPWEIF